jgi:hypothetical protein
MPARKILEEIGPVLAINSTSFVICLTDLELILKVSLLVISIIYTVQRWWSYHKNQK